jgi:hypothetical protein
MASIVFDVRMSVCCKIMLWELSKRRAMILIAAPDSFSYTTSHGGPQGAWEKSWSLRWNANTFAGAGYIVAMINPTGSTGYGQVKSPLMLCTNWLSIESLSS